MNWFERAFGGHRGHSAQRGHGRSHEGGHGHHGGQGNEGWGRAPAPAAPRPPAAVICPRCNAGHPEGARFCSQCATPLVPQSCAQCRQALVQGAKFCSQCGAAAGT
ncbi:zinc-ribbon domain-containing protein [Caballeronia sp. LZ035]|uniref:zinc-ribbon domain-containing protein n=1 Tax=Caballeronia sp. LZ035 TaxID=3038568 RepID=UPI0028679B0D|nr:zinc-ribbon domain-containing protein [Caballeronia sp. LZ035]MDR5756313.1 zinc-ribbon domain-containing protein [Caballeronia sp. LZ035]